MIYTIFNIIKTKAIQYRDFCHVTIYVLYDIPTIKMIYEKII